MHGDVISSRRTATRASRCSKGDDGGRVAPPVPAGELQAARGEELQRLPSSLRQLDPAATYPVDLSHALVRLVRDFDERLGARETQAT